MEALIGRIFLFAISCYWIAGGTQNIMRGRAKVKKYRRRDKSELEGTGARIVGVIRISIGMFFMILALKG